MDKIETWLDPKIPVEYVAGSFVVLCILIIVCFISLHGKSVKHYVLYMLTAEYYFLVLCSTVICRTGIVNKKIELMPFYRYPDIWNKVDYPRDLVEALLNVALFVPIGLLLAGAMKRARWYNLVFVGFCMSLAIELLQLATSRGLCETDDVIHNTLGCTIGYIIVTMIYKNMKYIKAFWQFVSYLFVPQMGKQRRKHEQLNHDITYLIGKERSEGNLDPISSTYISHTLNVPLLDVEECMKELGL